MINNPKPQAELIRRAQQRRRDFERADNMTNITDQVPKLNTILNNPEILLSIIPPRAVMHALVVAIIPIAMLISRVDVVNRDVDAPVFAQTSGYADDFTVDVGH